MSQNSSVIVAQDNKPQFSQKQFDLFAAAHEDSLLGRNNIEKYEHELGFSLPSLRGLLGGLMFWRKKPTIGQSLKQLVEAMYNSWMELSKAIRYALAGTSVIGAGYAALMKLQLKRDRMAFEGETIWVRHTKTKKSYKGKIVSYGRHKDALKRRTLHLELSDGEVFAFPLDVIEVRRGDGKTFGKSTEIDGKWKNERMRAKFPLVGKESKEREAIEKAREKVHDRLRKLSTSKLLDRLKSKKSKSEKSDKGNKDAPVAAANVTLDVKAEAKPDVEDVDTLARKGVANLQAGAEQLIEAAKLDGDEEAIAKFEAMAEDINEMASVDAETSAEPPAETPVDPALPTPPKRPNLRKGKKESPAQFKRRQAEADKQYDAEVAKFEAEMAEYHAANGVEDEKAAS